MNSPRRILSIKTVLDRVPYSRTTVWRKSRDPDDPFPSAVDIGPNRTGIYEDEFESWLDGLSRRGASPHHGRREQAGRLMSPTTTP